MFQLVSFLSFLQTLKPFGMFGGAGYSMLFARVQELLDSQQRDDDVVYDERSRGMLIYRYSKSVEQISTVVGDLLKCVGVRLAFTLMLFSSPAPMA